MGGVGARGGGKEEEEDEEEERGSRRKKLRRRKSEREDEHCQVKEREKTKQDMFTTSWVHTHVNTKLFVCGSIP